MPITDDGFVPYTEEDIQQRLEQNLEAILGQSAEPGDLVTAQLESESETLAEIHEQALQRVYEAAYLEDATGQELDKLARLIGLSRQEATSATGTVRFSRSSPPSSNYTIPSGTEVQTGGTDPLVYETTEQLAIKLIDGFEGASISGWVGDTGAVSVVATTEMADDQALELPATAGVAIQTSETFKIGTIFDTDIRPKGDSITAFQFGHEDGSNYFEVEVDAASDDLRLTEYSGGSSGRSDTKSVTINADTTYHLEVEWSLYGDHRATLFESEQKENVLGEVFLENVDPPVRSTGTIGLKSKDSNAATLVDRVSTSGVTVNIEAQNAGTDTNIGPSTIRVIKNGLSGVEDVTNPVPTGGDQYLDTNLTPLVIGEDRETDDELRERAFENTSIGGAATLNSIATEIQRVEGVQSITTFQNKTENAKDGLPEHSFEVVVHGGTDKEVAEALFGSSSIDSQDVGGAHGTEVTYDIQSDVTDEAVTMHWSRPVTVDLDIDLDLIVDDTYVGDEEVRSLIAEYVGGTDIDGSVAPGLDVGENVYVAVLEQAIVNPDETGVWEVDSISIDSNGDGNDDTTTLANGADVVEIADSEVAQVSARDGSITINSTEK